MAIACTYNALDLPRIKTTSVLYIIYNEDQSFKWKEGQYDGMDEEEYPEKADLSPRYFVERLKITQWQDVIEYLNHTEYYSRPFWFVFEDETEDARLKFEELIKG